MRGEVRDDIKAENIPEDVSLEKQQEMLLINKMAAGGKLPPKSQSVFLQKRLQQRKFFDSGDYAMNQNKEKKQPPSAAAVPSAPPPSNAAAVASAPQPPPPLQSAETKPPILSPKQLNIGNNDQQPSSIVNCEEIPASLRVQIGVPAATVSTVTAESDSDEESPHLQIPRPDTVPQRKASILHPSVHSKLSPQPHIHHDKNDELIAAPPE